ncbi:MAG: coproporphyrinogen-III oxidase family protein [bacterium]
MLDHRARIDPKSHPPVRSLYIHIPFCAHKCHYCDFYSFVDTNDQQEVFLRRLIGELQALAPHAHGQPLKTIFIGGGTPSLLRADLWEQLLATINTHFDLSAIWSASPPRAAPWPDVEFTVECNPESTTAELLALLRAGGVDRISMGAQSFHRQHLLTLQRLHDPDRIGLVLEMCKAVGMPRTSIDLIYAIPGQTLEQWQEDLHKALALGTTHLSCYNLT